jgi:hypothetical protein
VTAPDPDSNAGITPWGRYIAQEHAARNEYLAITAEAHHQYLTGPWPDRDAYNRVEGTAWRVYYAAGRDAWRDYRDSMSPPMPKRPTTLFSEPGTFPNYLPAPAVADRFAEATFTPYPTTEA